MTFQLIYFAAERDEALEERLSALGETETRSGETRKAFLLALSEALSHSPVVLAAGGFPALSEALSRGLGLPLTAVDWSALGMENGPDVQLPKGALPLLLEREICGFILESGPQAILALDRNAAAPLFDAYLAPYLQARAGEGAPAEEVAPADEETVPASDLPPAVSQEPAAPVVPDESMTPNRPAYDVFAGMENAEVHFGREQEKPKKKRRKVWIPILCVALVLALIAGAGWYLLLRDGGSDGYYGHLMTEVYGSVGEGEPDEAFVSRYLTRFGALYQINPDVVGTVSVKSLDLALPFVSAAGKDESYYRWRRFDGTLSLYGTPYILAPYSESDPNPNLVIRGGRLFDPLNDLIDKGIGDAAIKTDSILYGEDGWEILSIMALDDAALDAYDDTFAALTAEQRQARAKAALRASLVRVDVTEADLDNVGLATNFLTLLAPCRSDSGKTLVVFARRAADADFEESLPNEQEEPTGSDETESSSETVSGDEQE